MADMKSKKIGLITSSVTLAILVFFALWTIDRDVLSSRHQYGLINFSIAFVLLAAHMAANILASIKLPKISGYILAGILAGPFVGGILTHEMVGRLKLIDDLALSFIALAAGGALHINSLKSRWRIISYNIGLQTLIVFGLVLCFSLLWGYFFPFLGADSWKSLIVFSMLLGTAAIARSPSSTMAIISECKASGPFTETVLGVTVSIDVLVIVFFTIILTLSKAIMSGTGGIEPQVFIALSTEIVVSFAIGVVFGKIITVYIQRIKKDLPLFLLFIAFGVTKTSAWLTFFMENHFHIHFAIEPLLICISAGFTVQNFSREGAFFEDSLEKVSLPIYVLFFSVAGAALNMDALLVCWPFALYIALVRIGGIFIATYTAGRINGDSAERNKNAWMAYLTQAGVAIGLAQIAERQFPEIGTYLTTVVLAVIAINQVAGPITFKLALSNVCEAFEE